ncbi:Sm-like protein lsm7 [Entomophthora muscae]|uniref:Sm-like protein lsm7 n=1 Tax=Entomophthora muscae TaxID=34485 RepID=A0ACC2UBV2_9FUNG|nr:Sm-like protein lsm7 [Entomophthora muscae]
MSDRGKSSGNRGTQRGGNNSRTRGGGRGSSSGNQRGGSQNSGAQERRPRKESILDLSKYMDKRIHVKFTGGREVTGLLKGHDPLLNLVLDETIELLKDPENPLRLSDKTRDLGLLVCRGPSVILISPLEGSEEIQNPFLQE